MCVDKYLVEDARALTQEVSQDDSAALLSRVLDALNAVEVPSTTDAGVPACHTAGRAPALASSSYRANEEEAVWPDNELAACRDRAEQGDPASTRRVAELLEVKGLNAEAVAWWRRAAAAGDRDAMLYLDLDILTEP